MKTGKNKYKTFFFKEYAGMAEKNTYSAYIPSDGKGLWVTVIDSETEENFAKAGVEAVVEKYLENSDFSMENMNTFLNMANKRIVESKISKGKEYNKGFSILTVIAEKNEIIVGNIGKTKLKLFRNNEIFKEVSEDKIKNIILEKNDYILVGSPLFWESINDTEISDMLISSGSKKELEKMLSEKIEKNEKSRKMSIPFLSIFVEDLEEKKVETLIKTEEKRINPLKYLLIMLVLLFLFIAVGKTVQNKGYVKKAQEHIILSEEKFKNKRFKESVNEIDAAILYYKKISPQNKKIKEKINELQKKKEIAEKEEQNLINSVNKIKITVPAVEPPKAPEPVVVEEEVAEKTEVTVADGNIKKKKTVKTKRRESSKNDRQSDLDREIQRNWKALGRDNNGNKKNKEKSF